MCVCVCNKGCVNKSVVRVRAVDGRASGIRKGKKRVDREGSGAEERKIVLFISLFVI